MGSEMCIRDSRYGVRVPAVIVSPWVPKGKVDPTLYDHTSILATLRTKLGLKHLTERDRQANDLWDLLSEPAPRSDIPAVLPDPVKPPARDAAPTVPPDDLPLPRSGNMIGFLHVLLKAEIELAEKSGERAVADIVADFHQMTTHAHASDYVAKMKAMLDGLESR